MSTLLEYLHNKTRFFNTRPSSWKITKDKNRRDSQIWLSFTSCNNNYFPEEEKNIRLYIYIRVLKKWPKIPAFFVALNLKWLFIFKSKSTFSRPCGLKREKLIPAGVNVHKTSHNLGRLLQKEITRFSFLNSYEWLCEL